MHKLRNAATMPLEQLLNPIEFGVSADLLPTIMDFKLLADTFSKSRKQELAVALSVSTIGDMAAELAIELDTVHRILGMKEFRKAVLIGKILHFKTHTQQSIYVAELIRRAEDQKSYHEQLENLVINPQDYIKQLGAAIRTDGDSKRELLKQLIGYGMQSKVVEQGYHDLETGQIVPSVYAMADPKIALSSLQELNKMDHEYADVEKAASSMESHAEKIRRLKEDADKLRKAHVKNVAKIGGVASDE